MRIPVAMTRAEETTQAVETMRVVEGTMLEEVTPAMLGLMTVMQGAGMTQELPATATATVGGMMGVEEMTVVISRRLS